MEQAQQAFDAGLIGDALPRYNELSQELASLGPEHADNAARCRLGAARCLAHLGEQRGALEELQALVQLLEIERPPEDRLLLDVRFQLGQLLLALDDTRGLTALFEVYQKLKAAERPEDTAMMKEVGQALTRAISRQG